jgi:hypothetical protein
MGSLWGVEGLFHPFREGVDRGEAIFCVLAQSGSAMPKVTALFILCLICDLETARRHPKPCCTPSIVAWVAQRSGIADDDSLQCHNENQRKPF